MWIELLVAAGELKPGFHDIADETIARSYITAGLAKDAGDGPDKIILKRAMDAYREQLSTFTRGIADELQEQAKTFKRPNLIEPGEAEADKTRSDGDFVRQVFLAEGTKDPDISTKAHERLTKVYGVSRAMSEGQGSTGGYTTPVIYESMWQKIAAENAVVSPRARQVPLGARTVEWPALDQYQVPTAGQSAFFGGVKIFRKGENTARTSSQPGLKKISLTAQDLIAFTDHISRDLLADASTPIDGMISQLMGEAIGWRIDYECFQGNGVGQFLGYFNAPCTISVTRNTGSTIKYVDITGMYKRLLAQSQGNAIWVCHPYTADTLLQIQDPGSRYIFQPQLNLAGESTLGAAPKWQMLGIPVIFSEKVPVTGTLGDLSLIDCDKFLLGTRSGLEVGLSDQFRYDTDEVVIRAKIRNDGQPWLKSAITLADGASTVSAFIILN